MCKYLISIYIHVNVNAEHVSVNVKLCKSNLCYVKQHKCQTNTLIWFYVAIFLLGGRGGFHNVFVDRPTKWDIKKKQKNKTSKHAPTINYYGSQEDMIIKGI